MKPIIGHSNLKRDANGVIHNVDAFGLEAAKLKKREREDTLNRLASLENDVNEIKGSLSEILELVKRL